MKPHNSWKVLPHGDLEKVAENLYVVEGKLPMPLGETTRHMTIVRLTGGRLAIFSAIALDQRRMAQLEQLGAPTFLIVPSAIHRIDAKPWKQRYPDLEVIAPERALAKISDVVEVDSTEVDLGDPNVQLVNVPGTNCRELAMIVQSTTGKTLVINDLIFNMPRLKPIAQLGFRLLGFGPGQPTIPKLVARKLVANDNEMRAQLRQWAEMADLERIIVAHGAPITDDPRGVLRKLAA